MFFSLTETDVQFIHKNMFAAVHSPHMPEGTPDVLRRLAMAFAGLFEAIGRAFNPQPNPNGWWCKAVCVCWKKWNAWARRYCASAPACTRRITC